MKPSVTDISLALELNGIVTPKSCSYFICELIKYIVYSKRQIPFPFERLKMYVLKRKEKLKLLQGQTSDEAEASSCSRDQLVMEKYFKKVEEAFEALEVTFKCIEQKLMESTEYSLLEIVILFGATPVSPKEIYRIAIPPLTYHHSASQGCLKKQIGNMFRQIIISEELDNNIQRRVGLTNMFVMYKVKTEISSEWVLPRDHFTLSNRAHQVCFSFRTKSEVICTCDSDAVQLNRVIEKMANLNIREAEALCGCEVVGETSKWFQIEKTFKGFKDCKRQGKSVADMWYRHRFL